MYLTIENAQRRLNKHGYILIWHSLPECKHTTVIVHSWKIYTLSEAKKQHKHLFNLYDYTIVQLLMIYDYVKWKNDTIVLETIAEEITKRSSIYQVPII